MEKVPLDSNPNVYENYYKFSKDARKIVGEIDFDYQPFAKLTKTQVKAMIGPAISMSRLLKSFFETQIHYLETIRESGFSEEAVNHINHTLKWVENKDGKPLLLSRNSSSFGFFSERESFPGRNRPGGSF